MPQGRAHLVHLQVVICYLCVEVTTVVSGGSCPGARRTRPPGASASGNLYICVKVTTAVSGGSCPDAPRTRPPGASASGPPPGGSRARDARWVLLIF
jgi:hypothetical protein